MATLLPLSFAAAVAQDADALVSLRIAAVLAHVFAQADARGLAMRVGALRGSDSNRFYLRHGLALVEQGEFDNYYIRAAQPA